MEPTDKKKRGRPRKNADEKKTTETKKRGRNPKPLIISNIEPLTISVEEEEQFILFIPCKNYKKPEDPLESDSTLVYEPFISEIKKEEAPISTIIKSSVGENVFTKITIYHLKTPLINDGTYFCWWDCHPFTGSVIMLPYEYVEPAKKFNNIKGNHKETDLEPFFKTRGCFCSFNCAKSWNKYFSEQRKREQRNVLLLFLCRKMIHFKKEKEAIDTLTIKEAPLRETLSSFGGHMNIEEFRKSFINTYSISVYPKIFPLQVTIEEMKNESHTNIPKSVIYSNQKKKPTRSKLS